MAETPRLAPVIRCQSLAKSFGGLPVLKDIGCEVAPGEVLAVMGRSGSGKSTLLRLLALLERPDAGNVWLRGEQYLRHGEPLVDPVRIRRRISIVFQQFNLFPNLSVLGNCTLGPIRALQHSRADANRAARELLTSFGLASLIDRYPETLSGGEAQRVAVARALLMRPEVLLLDEVTSSLDPESIFKVLDMIRAIRSVEGSRGAAIILVTHLLAFAESFATNIAYLHGGVFVDVLPAKMFAIKAEFPATRQFIQQSRSNWI